jgi:hypothetical protein
MVREWDDQAPTAHVIVERAANHLEPLAAGEWVPQREVRIDRGYADDDLSDGPESVSNGGLVSLVKWLEPPSQETTVLIT